MTTMTKQFLRESKVEYKIRLLAYLKELEADERASSSKNEPEEEKKHDFFGSLFKDKRCQKSSATKIAKSYLEKTLAKNILASFALHEKLHSCSSSTTLLCHLVRLWDIFFL